MNKTLLPCAFCGGTPTIEDVHISDPAKAQHKECVSIGCENCDYTLMTGAWNLGWHTSRESATTAWNSRVNPPSGGGDEINQKLPESRDSTGLGGRAQACPEGWPTEEMITAFAEIFSIRDQRGTFRPAFRAALLAATDAPPSASPDMSNWCRLSGCSHKNAGSPAWETEHGADKADADRYRWLRDNNGVDNDLEVEVFIEGQSNMSGHLCTQVDRAMQQEDSL